MSQLSMFKEDLNKVVNVSKVTHLSPFRYPGGKTWLVPRIRQWVIKREKTPHLFLEPFAGGGIISLTIAAENLAEKIIMVELDDQVAAAWKTIFNRNWKWLADKISTFDLTYDSAKLVINAKQRSTRDKAFQTLLKNRIYHGGILAEGSGMLKHGENGKGIHSRWYPETIKKRIYRISAFKSKIQFIQEDGLAVMERFLDAQNVMCFIDPPYTAGGKRAGKRLYRLNNLDHDKIFYLAMKMKADCLLTYDDSQEVRELADKYGFATRLVAMQNTHLSKMKELLIGKNLSWLD